MKHTIQLSILSILFTITTLSHATDSFHWQKIDQQDSKLVKDVYAGLYESVKKNFSANDKDDMIKMFNYGVVHDVYTLHEYCHNCGYCPTCVIGEAFGTAEKSTFKKTKARKYYNKAKSLGHPYAEFMLRRANIVSGGKAHYTTGLVSTSQTDKLILKRLKKHVDNQDSVATFMYYFLKTNLVIRPDSARWFTEKNEKIIKTTISLLEKEAKEGRILAMFYLGITYRLQQDYKKSFAWFYLADKLNHNKSGWYAQNTLKFLEKNKEQKEAVAYLKEVLGYF